MQVVEASIALNDVGVEPALVVRVLRVDPCRFGVGLGSVGHSLLAVRFHVLTVAEVACLDLGLDLTVHLERSVTASLLTQQGHRSGIVLVQQGAVGDCLTSLLRGQLSDDLIGALFGQLLLVLIVLVVSVRTGLHEVAHCVCQTVVQIASCVGGRANRLDRALLFEGRPTVALKASE
ncbi:hypothetical protein KKMOLJDB_00006 [Pseudomonas phage phi C106]|nr:hypothetical protein KKMOLJDB_00006 [Pseudomonas phage phi C106]